MTNIQQLAREKGLNYDEVKAMFDASSKIRQKKTWSPVKRIGLDELSTRKGHKHFKTVIADLDRGCLIDILNTHKTDEIIETLIQQPLQIRQGVEEVSPDMWGAFPESLVKFFNFAILVYDRFHVMQMVNRRLNHLRRQFKVTVKGSRNLLFKNYQDFRT